MLDQFYGQTNVFVRFAQLPRQIAGGFATHSRKGNNSGVFPIP